MTEGKWAKEARDTAIAWIQLEQQRHTSESIQEREALERMIVDLCNRVERETIDANVEKLAGKVEDLIALVEGRRQGITDAPASRAASPRLPGRKGRR